MQRAGLSIDEKRKSKTFHEIGKGDLPKSGKTVRMAGNISYPLLSNRSHPESFRAGEIFSPCPEGSLKTSATDITPRFP